MFRKPAKPAATASAAPVPKVIKSRATSGVLSPTPAAKAAVQRKPSNTLTVKKPSVSPSKSPARGGKQAEPVTSSALLKSPSQRRRLSVVSSSTGFEADGAIPPSLVPPGSDHHRRASVNYFGTPGTGVGEEDARLGDDCLHLIARYASKSKAGVVPMNPHKVNQDAHFEIENFAQLPGQYFFCVMDGHGFQGQDVSGQVKRRLPINVAAEANLQSDPVTALFTGFQKTNEELFRSSIDISFSGSTTVSCLIRGKKIYCANVGDSRAILGRKYGSNWEAVALSEDHKPDRKDEEKRILASNGRVDSFRGMDGEPIGPLRVWLKNQDAPGLAMSRSMGDSVAASVGVTAYPEILERECDSHDKFIVIASDGVWEFISNQEAVNIVSPFYDRDDPQGACDELVRESNYRWRQEEEVIDDTTCIVVFFKNSEKR
eukprot:GILJ01000634.1.p1 GENE.GILJ01000634.1~~GILJ01000634.1.p1  ORF type:complete len:431 (+),score=61.09 GILJ01000634.1:46-1338(+)